jgi:ketosteroid isomerase-like protein
VTDENMQFLREVYDRWGQGDFSVGMERYDPHVQLIFAPGFPLEHTGVFTGEAGVREYMGDFLGAWKQVSIGAEGFVVEGDSVAVAVRQRAEGRESGATVDLRFFQVWTFRGSHVIRIDNFRERAEALEAIGAAD